MMPVKPVFVISFFASISLLNILTAQAESPDTRNVVTGEETGLPPSLRSTLQRDFDEQTFGQRPDINYADDPRNQDYEEQRCNAGWCIDTGNFGNQNRATSNIDGRLPEQAPSTLRLRQDFDINR